MADAEAAPGGAGAEGIHGFLHEHQVFGAAHNTVGAAHAELEVQGRFQHALFQIIGSIGDHAGVECLDLRLHVPLLHISAQFFQELGAVDKQAAVHPVHGAAVVRTHFGAQLLEVDLAGFLSGVQVAGSGHVQDDVALGMVFAQQLHRLAEFIDVHGAVAVVVAHVHMGYGGACLPAGVNIFRNFRGGHGDIGIIFFLRPCAGQGHSDDALVFQFCHDKISFVIFYNLRPPRHRLSKPFISPQWNFVKTGRRQSAGNR